VVLLAVLKIVAPRFAMRPGNAAGIFGPSLFIGAMMGAAVGGVAQKLFPGYTAGPGAYALVRHGNRRSPGLWRTPLTSVFMIFEITRDYTIIGAADDLEPDRRTSFRTSSRGSRSMKALSAPKRVYTAQPRNSRSQAERIACAPGNASGADGRTPD